MLDLDIFAMNLRFSKKQRVKFPEKHKPEKEHVSFSKNAKIDISFIVIFFFVFCIFENSLGKRITLMDSKAKNICFGGKQTSEQAFILPLTMLILCSLLHKTC